MFQNIDIVIPVFSKKVSQIDRLLESLIKQDVSGFNKVNVFIVVNPVSSTEQKLWIGRWSDVIKSDQWSITTICCENAGVNNARQLGLVAGKSSCVFFFDDDIVIDEQGLLAKHFQHHQQHPDLFACGGYYQTTSSASLFSKLYLSRQQQWLNQSYLDHTKKSAGYLLGGHFSIKRSLLDQNRIAFDTSIKFGSSETDFFLSARKKGMILHLQKWCVSHAINDSTFRLFEKTYLQGRGKKYSEKKGLSFNPIYRSTVTFESFGESFISFFYDLAFNWGYFSFDRQYSLFFKTYFNDISLFFSYQKQKIINYLRTGL